MTFSSCSQETPSDPSTDWLASFELEDGFVIEQIVSEPLVSDPVDMEIDEYGRLYVVEMHGYPLDKSGTGKIVLLTDSNQDGKLDKRTIFADSLILPNSIMRWKNGVIVTDAPYVLYFEDANGDGFAEVRDTLLTGFALSNPQHNLNNPVLGMDNWIYLAHEGAVGTETYAEEFGDPGREIYYTHEPNAPRLAINAGGRAVRFRPDRHALEMTSSHSQFGHTFDTWGHHFEVGNANHIFHEVISESYLKRNPDLPVSNATQSISDHKESAEVFPITINPEHQLLTDVGVITSACGLTAYLGGAFPEPYDHVTFVAEPVSNLVHVDLVKDAGATFTAERMRPHSEFLASRDPKFRPVNMYVGPDGALYVIDYYRQIIEHPEWMGEEVIKSGALYNDTDRGRIYRITAKGAAPPSWISGLSLGDESSEQLVGKLSSPNSWWRINAQRLLIDRADKEAIPMLAQMATNNSAPLGRVHALWTLEGLGELSVDQIKNALGDPIGGVRENAIKLAEPFLADAKELVSRLLALQSDPDPKVRFQLLCTLGSLNTAEATAARYNLLFEDVEDKWVQIAALSASSSQASALLNEVLSRYKNENTAYDLLVRRLTTMLGAAGKPEDINQLIRQAANAKSGDKDGWKGPALDGLALGLEKQKNVNLSGVENLLVTAFFEHPSPLVRKGSLHLLRAAGIRDDALANRSIQEAMRIATVEGNPESRRADAIDFISLRDPSSHASVLMALFVPTQELPIQLASLRTLSEIPDTTVSGYLIRHWPILTPEIRDAAISTFFADDARIEMLLTAMEKGEIQLTEIPWYRKVGLMAQSNETLRNKARVIITRRNDDHVNAAYEKALGMDGDAVIGKNVYQQQCALCHQVRGDLGTKLGPDLGTIHNWSKQAIMANILDPNQSISSGYDLWAIELVNGEKLQGIIATETPGAITIQNVGMQDKTISRKEIKSLVALSLSVMPTDLDKQINVQQMADLLAFLKANK